MTKEQLLRDAADDCQEHANDLLRDAPNMGLSKERRYKREAAEVMARVVALRVWADELAAHHEPTCECKEQREAWICVKCGKPEASVPHGNPLDQMAAGAELYGDPATPGYKR